MSTTRTGRRDRATAPVVADDCLELVKQFPLRPIKSDAEVKFAGALLDRFVGRDDLTPGQQDYVAALTRFVRDFEEQTYRRKFASRTAVEMMRHLLDENGMSTSDLGTILGSRGLASEVLNGKRGLSKALIAKLAKRFRVDPSVFLDTADAET